VSGGMAAEVTFRATRYTMRHPTQWQWWPWSFCPLCQAVSIDRVSRLSSQGGMWARKWYSCMTGQGQRQERWPLMSSASLMLRVPSGTCQSRAPQQEASLCHLCPAIPQVWWVTHLRGESGEEAGQVGGWHDRAPSFLGVGGAVRSPDTPLQELLHRNPFVHPLQTASTGSLSLSPTLPLPSCQQTATITMATPASA
jgi:hypothetical protein